jgi:hypothetical protein
MWQDKKSTYQSQNNGQIETDYKKTIPFIIASKNQIPRSKLK